MAQPTGLFTYSYDPAGHIANLVNPEVQTTSWQYDAASRVTATVMANGTFASIPTTMRTSYCSWPTWRRAAQRFRASITRITRLATERRSSNLTAMFLRSRMTRRTS